MKEALIGDHGSEDGQNWTRSFAGMAIEPFEKEVADILMKPLDPADIEIKPGWGLAPRSEHSISPKNISREYALICRGRFVSTARGEQDYFDVSNLATASEGCKSNALMRCCKDLGIASELWDPSFIRKFKKQYCDEQFVEHAVTKKKKKLWKRKDQPDFATNGPGQILYHIVSAKQLKLGTGTFSCSQNASEQVANEGQNDADDTSDGSFLGIAKKNIDDEFKKFMDELGYYGHGANDSDMEQHSNNDNERSMPNASAHLAPILLAALLSSSFLLQSTVTSTPSTTTMIPTTPMTLTIPTTHYMYHPS
ncbi:hypothetical protein BGZ82_004482, partial [Podila clonocystis]